MIHHLIESTIGIAAKQVFSLLIRLGSVSLFIILLGIIGEAYSTDQSHPPVLLTDPLIPASPDMLRLGLWGSVSVQAEIDSGGFVISALVEPSGNQAFDSLVKDRVESAHFTPAIVNGRAVASTVSFEVVVPYDSLLAQCSRLTPNFTGIVVDTTHFTPVPNARILLHYSDTTRDTSIAIGFNNYLSIIGKLTQQKFKENSLVTVTDSLGHFTFRLLPYGPFTLSVQSQGYEIGNFRDSITGDELRHSRYVLDPIGDISKDDTYEITVYGRSDLSEELINIAEQERMVGFSPYLSHVVQAKSEIRRLPEGPSKMMVRSGSPYDNVYLIAGIPMLAPFHFGGHPYADIDGLMISGLEDVRVIINDIAAIRLDVSGCIVQANPGRVIYDNHSTPRGSYIKGDYSMLGVDLLGAYSAINNPDDFIQVGFSKSHDYGIKWTGNRYASVQRGMYGIGSPVDYGNFTLSGLKTVGPLYLSGFGWFAWDSYDPYADSKAERLPWGMGSIKIGSHSSNRSLTIGRAHQFFGSGKQVISTVHTTRSYLDNNEIAVDLDTILTGPVTVKLSARINHDRWNGLVSQQENRRVVLSYKSEGTETGFHLNPSFSIQTNPFSVRLNLLTSAINYSDSTQFIADAGTSVNYSGRNFQTGLHLGRITSRPDIRGVPAFGFRKQLNRTYIASLPFFLRYGVITRLGIQPYIRYSTNAPQLDPLTNVWSHTKTSHLRAYGTDFSVHIKPSPQVGLTTAINLAEARRDGEARDVISYEWHIPWTLRTSLHLSSRNDRFHLYADYIRTKGLPYYNFDKSTYEALPVYHSIDLNAQFHAIKGPPQRFVNKLACYVTIKNLQDFITGVSNVRDFYWDSNNRKQSIFLGHGRIDVGARFGISL
ncbi:hypothetical protein CHISP_3663 [Chitinispirillum alkaliphilum]|nr:hypothetical protein CHISP_3663 [Chitinispirillum alkaliphilum]